ncbi:Cytochrome b6 [uncultured Thiomicrorhabdus sp.]
MATQVSHNPIQDHYTESGEHIVSRDRKVSDIGSWLKKGWMDMAHAPAASLFYGAIMALSVLLVYSSFRETPIMMFKIATFFVMLTPFLATGLYATSCQLSRNEKPNLMNSIFAWRHNKAEFAFFALLLGVVIAIWGRVTPLIGAIVESNSLLIINPNQGVMSFLTSEAGQAFMGYFLVGAVILAAIVFAVSVVTIPLLLRDHNIGAVSAMILSFKIVMQNKLVMSLWALTIGVLVTLGIVTFGLAMLVVMPLLGYASWHAFNDLIMVDDKRASNDIQV